MQNSPWENSNCMITIKKKQSYFTLRNFAAFILVLFCIHYIPLETRANASIIKTAASAICCFIFVLKVPHVTKALVLATIYFLTILFSAIFHMETLRVSTLLYLCSFLITFITIYNLVHVTGVLTLKYFITIVKKLIYALTIVLIIQQCFLIIGIRLFPLVNLCQILDRGIGSNSLTMEPSVFARIMGVLFYSYMECISFQNGFKFRFRQLFEQEHKWVTYAFLWSMLTMGSGTAFIVIGVLSLYFINLRNALIIVPLLTGLIYLGSASEIKQFKRATSVAKAAMTLDNKTVIQSDHSASYRILPILNTINNLNLTKTEHWFGYGIDAGVSDLSKTMLPGITDYGFLAYLISLLLVFSCAIRFWSIPTIMYFIGIGGGTANIAYGWGILMIFMCVRYFYENKNNPTITKNE